MSRIRPIGVTIMFAGAILATVGAASAARVHILVSPAAVAPGAAIRITAAASPCRPGDTVSAISAAFPGHPFGGEGALAGHATAAGAFTIRGHVRAGLRAGAYSIGFRCGGGNIGVGATVRVT